MLNNPNILAIVGSDQVGKNTQAHLLKYFIQKHIFIKTKKGCRNARVAVIEVPYKFSLTFPIIHVMLKFGIASKLPRFFQFIQFLNKYFLQIFEFPYYLFRYDVIILDRWSECSIVYGLASGIKEDSSVLKLAKLLIRADKTIVLLGHPHDGVIDHRDEYEANATLQENVRKLYKEWALKNKNNTFIVNANQAVLDVHSDIVAAIFGNDFVGPK